MICILLSTYNGEAHLEAQLQSLIEQQGVEYFILVRDDGSTDSTHEILDRWQAQGKLTWYAGENIKPCASFMHLLRHAPNADHYAFCDQDDVWMNDKLAAAMPHLETSGCAPTRPALYFSSQLLIDADGQPLGSRLLHHTPTLRRALTDYYATGCTMIFNHALRQAVLCHSLQHVDMHDEWIYKVCMTVGGRAYADPSPHILYRQHNNNYIGMGKKGRYGILGIIIWQIKHHNDTRLTEAQELLAAYGDQLPPNELAFLTRLTRYRTHLGAKLRLALSPHRIYETLRAELLYRTAILFNAF